LLAIPRSAFRPADVPQAFAALEPTTDLDFFRCAAGGSHESPLFARFRKLYPTSDNRRQTVNDFFAEEHLIDVFPCATCR
jgi:hypothetical protein